MSFMEFSSPKMHSSSAHLNRSLKPFWLTSNSYEFPNYACLDPNVSKRISLILYYAHIMDQKKLLKDFFRICKDSFENQCGTCVLESAVKTWIKHSILKLQRRREQIISNAVTACQTDMLRTIYRVLLSIFCDLVRECRHNSHLNALSKKTYSSAIVNSKRISASFHRKQLLSPTNSRFKDFRTSISEWDKLLISQQFLESKCQVMSVSSHPNEWLQKFWLKFCYQPDPKVTTMYNGETSKATDISQNFNQKCSTNKPTDFMQNSHTCSSNKTYLVQNCSSNTITGPYSTTQMNFTTISKDFLKETIQNTSLDAATNFNQTQKENLDRKSKQSISSEDSSSISTKEDSDSSDSWSCADFDDGTSDDDAYFSSISMSHGISLDKCNSTLKWLQSTQDLSSDEESVVFEGVITEENCLEHGGTRGSLYFVDTDDDFDDFDVMFSSECSKSASFVEDDYEDKSQGYVNPCFEEEFRSFCMPKFITTVNECWGEMMLGIEKKPRQASKVSFAPDASLVTIYCFERTEENSYDHSVVLDRLRFQRRISELNNLLSPIFTCEHRAEVRRRSNFYQDGC